MCPVHSYIFTLIPEGTGYERIIVKPLFPTGNLIETIGELVYIKLNTKNKPAIKKYKTTIQNK